MSVIGRSFEEKELLNSYNSSTSELVAVYGRRRVGKTYLIDNTFADSFDFKHTGLSPIELNSLKTKDKNKTILELQLQHFYHSLKLYGMKENKIPSNWLEAFFMLEQLLDSKEKNRKLVVFIDELPWLDTKKSLFITSFESFWNGWANGKNILVIVCGSAISWMTNALINNHGGLYGRVTKEINVLPLNLSQCKELLLSKHINLSDYDIAQTYMIFGGIPYYLNYLKRNLSLSQNVDSLFFGNNSILANEFDRLFASTFNDDELAKKVVNALSEKKIGYTRNELADKIKISDGDRFSKVINSLIVSGYIVKYKPLQDNEKKLYFKLIDPFCLFYLSFVKNQTSLDKSLFSANASSQKITSWRGIAFENVCYNHIPQLKAVLGISGVVTNHYSLVYQSDSEKGAQIDLILERNDNIVHLCEIKFYSNVFVQTKEEHIKLLNKSNVLSKFIKRKESIRNVLITTYGLKENEYQWDYDHVITLEDLI